MSDFDKYFADRLDEEGPFPGREKNWKSLSKRLDAFDTGLRGNSGRLRYWQAAAAVSILAVSVLFGKVYQMYRENIALREQVSALQEEQTAWRTEAPAETPATTSHVPEHQDNIVNGERATSPAPFPDGKFSTPSIPTSRTPGPGTERPASKPENEGNLTQKPLLPVATEPLTGPGNKNNPAEKLLPGQATAEHLTGTENKSGPEAIQPLKQTPVEPLPLKFEVARRMTKQTAPLQPVAVQEKEIRPLRHNFSRYRLGVQTAIGFPETRGKGISLLTGAGVTAGYKIAGNLRLGASADWLRHEVKADSLLENCHLPPAPPKPKPNHKLTQIAGSQRSQLLSLSLAYTIPLRFPVKPAFRVAHTWARWSPAVYHFRFDDKKNTPPPFHQPNYEYEPQESEPSWSTNNWRFGAGLEYESPRLAFGIWADYSKNLANRDRVSNALFLRAGVEYKFD